ncbi:MAG: NAD-dependent epimerase/dehydratase family protein [Myxococcales bacterium]|nr:NAD-dependent epimerase/dehydratase family protein [Myxococcales bacterium]
MTPSLVTGGCGFLGSSIVKQLVQAGRSVRVLALPHEVADNLRGVDVELVRGDIRDREACERAVAGCETVFHAAAIYKAWAPDPTDMYRVNLSGTFNMLEASRRAGVQRVVYTASIVSLGRPAKGGLADENTAYEAWDIDFPYSRSKYHSRELAEDFARFGLDVRIVCPGVVLGPGDITPTPSGKLILNTLKGGPPVYIDAGASYVDVRDAARVHVLAADKGRPGERYIATAHNLTALEFMQAVDDVAGRSRRYVRVPTSVARGLVKAMEAAARRTGKEPLLSRNFFEYSTLPCFCTGKRAERELGATYRPLSETLHDAIAYFRERGLA